MIPIAEYSLFRLLFRIENSLEFRFLRNGIPTEVDYMLD